jgi:hypothetical protein
MPRCTLITYTLQRKEKKKKKENVSRAGEKISDELPWRQRRW